MYKGKRVGVVVPAYNEEKLIGRVIETMPDFVDRVYVVDDCSTDGTCEEVTRRQREGARGGNLELIRHEVNQGVGGAIVTGYEKALDDGMDVMAVMAGDAQMDPADLPNVIEAVVTDAADYVKGNRFFSGKAWETIPRHRYLGNALLSLLTKIASGYWHIADSQTGYTAISRRALQTLPLGKLYRRYGYPNHLLVMLNVYGCRTMDVPIEPVYPAEQVSGIKLHRVIPRMALLILTQFLWRLKEKYVIRDFHPLLFFYALGAGLLFACLPLMVRLCWVLYATGSVPVINSLALMFAGIVGLQSVFFAMLFDMQYNGDLCSKPPRRAPSSSPDRPGLHRSTIEIETLEETPESREGKEAA